MENEKNILKKIEELRELMHTLIAQEGNLLHYTVINVSQDLDKALNEYHKVVNN